MNNEKLDLENCGKDSRIKAALEPDEDILASVSLFKYSNNNIQQKRILLITSKYLCNVAPQSSFANFFSKAVSSLKIKR